MIIHKLSPSIPVMYRMPHAGTQFAVVPSWKPATPGSKLKRTPKETPNVRSATPRAAHLTTCSSPFGMKVIRIAPIRGRKMVRSRTETEGKGQPPILKTRNEMSTTTPRRNVTA